MDIQPPTPPASARRAILEQVPSPVALGHCNHAVVAHRIVEDALLNANDSDLAPNNSSAKVESQNELRPSRLERRDSVLDLQEAERQLDQEISEAIQLETEAFPAEDPVNWSEETRSNPSPFRIPGIPGQNNEGAGPHGQSLSENGPRNHPRVRVLTSSEFDQRQGEGNILNDEIIRRIQHLREEGFARARYIEEEAKSRSASPHREELPSPIRSMPLRRPPPARQPSSEPEEQAEPNNTNFSERVRATQQLGAQPNYMPLRRRQRPAEAREPDQASSLAEIIETAEANIDQEPMEAIAQTPLTLERQPRVFVDQTSEDEFLNETNLRLLSQPQRLMDSAERVVGQLNSTVNQIDNRLLTFMTPKSLLDISEKIPLPWLEEVLVEEFMEDSICIAILELCGPLTLFLYQRCLQCSTFYEEVGELRSLIISGTVCSREYREHLKNMVLKRFNQISHRPFRRGPFAENPVDRTEVLANRLEQRQEEHSEDENPLEVSFRDDNFSSPVPTPVNQPALLRANTVNSSAFSPACKSHQQQPEKHQILSPSNFKRIIEAVNQNESFPSISRLSCFPILSKLTSFFNFNLSMAKHDIVSEWRLQLFVQKILPSAEQLHQLISSPQLKPNELLLIKTIIEMVEVYLGRDAYHNRKVLYSDVSRLKKALYKQMAKMKGACLDDEALGRTFPTQVEVLAVQSWQFREEGKLNGFYKYIQIHCSLKEAFNTIEHVRLQLKIAHGLGKSSNEKAKKPTKIRRHKKKIPLEKPVVAWDRRPELSAADVREPEILVYR